jgi:hypothetical protein
MKLVIHSSLLLQTCVYEFKTMLKLFLLALSNPESYSLRLSGSLKVAYALKLVHLAKNRSYRLNILQDKTRTFRIAEFIWRILQVRFLPGIVQLFIGKTSPFQAENSVIIFP